MFDHYLELLSSFYLKSEITMIVMFLLPAKEAGPLISFFKNCHSQLVFHLAIFKVEDFYVHLMS
jgi:hypothetical protein